MEEEAVLKLTNLTDISEGPVIMNPTKGGSSDTLINKYLGQLSCDTLLRLYKRFLPDFVLFNYDIVAMLSWAEGGKGCDFGTKLLR